MISWLTNRLNGIATEQELVAWTARWFNEKERVYSRLGLDKLRIDAMLSDARIAVSKAIPDLENPYTQREECRKLILDATQSFSEAKVLREEASAKPVLVNAYFLLTNRESLIDAKSPEILLDLIQSKHLMIADCLSAVYAKRFERSGEHFEATRRVFAAICDRVNKSLLLFVYNIAGEVKVNVANPEEVAAEAMANPEVKRIKNGIQSLKENLADGLSLDEVRHRIQEIDAYVGINDERQNQSLAKMGLA